MKRSLILILIILLNTNLYSQKSNSKIVIQTDSTEYVSGESIWFSVFYNEFNQNQITYCELINQYGNVIERVQVKMNNGAGSSVITLPDSVSTGYYNLIAYTADFNYLNSNNLSKIELLIYNPEVDFLKVKDDSITYSGIVEKEQGIKVFNLKNQYKVRSQVSFSIKKDDLSSFDVGKFSVSIRKHSPFNDHTNKLNIDDSDNSSLKANNPLIESNGILLVGTILNAKKEVVKDVKVDLYYVDSISQTQHTYTNAEGHFFFLTEPNRKIKDFVVKVDSKEDLTILIEDKYLNDYSKLKGKGIESVDSFKLAYLNELYINSRINEVFRLSAKDSLNEQILEKRKWQDNNFYYLPDKTIEFDNYVLLDSIQEYFHEFFPSVYVQKRDGVRQFRIVGTSKVVLIGQPALFIDGVLFNDIETFLSINPKFCDRIEVVKSNYLIYNKIYGGLIFIYTKNLELGKVKIPRNTSRLELELFDEKESFKSINTKNTIPNFQNTIYWNPELIIDKDDINIDVSLGDDTGYFIVDIVGVSNNGKLLRATKRIEVVVD